MKAAKNRERILDASIELFNQAGVVAITTNHIADHLKISPGNLYFHFRNKEEIVRELFDRMCDATYSVWKTNIDPDKKEVPTPAELIERSFAVFWDYRFFHREMYHLRRKDPALARKWRSHLAKTMRLLQATYGHWVKAGIMKKVSDPKEMQMISDVVLITSSSFLQFFESPEKPASRKSVKQGVHHIARLLSPYHTEAAQSQLRTYLEG
ncbi:MAG: TetR/AcrR family transcriptional regulator [Bdellovibrionaceae bacterium]|nr:TetR/AcrR family transcriptional regulator [Pseudobdellovibrionaceae bacterium]